MTTELLAKELKNDPRIQQAKELILNALHDTQKKLTTIHGPIESQKDHYQKLLKECGKLRGGELYYPYIGSGFGNGALVELADGSIKYDLISGIGPHYWGHSHPDLVEAEIDAALSDTIMQGNLQQNEDSVRLMNSMIQLAQKQGGWIEHCFLSTSGAIANENALKIIFQKNAPADRILCFEKCFSGRTLSLAQMTDKAAYRKGLPLAIDVDYIPFYDYSDPHTSTERAVNTLKHHLQRFPDRYAGMCLELIQGEAGYYSGSRDFFLALFDVLKEHNIAIWIDEIQTFGRTSQPFAFQHFELDDYIDVVTVGKLSQVCATLFTPDYKPTPGLLSQTFTASTSAIAAGQVILDSFLEESFFGVDGKIAQWHDRFVGYLQDLSTEYPNYIQGPFGVGAMVAFTVFGGSFEKSKAFANRLYDAGVISFLAGSNPTRIRFLLPIAAITSSDIDNASAIIKNTLKEMISAEKNV